MGRSMRSFEANVMAGRAKSVDGKYFLIYELNEMSEKYTIAWKKFKQNID